MFNHYRCGDLVVILGFASMKPDDEICLCHHVTLRKIRTFLDRENPPKVSLISECLGAGTGCGWCVPFLEELHAQHKRGDTPDLPVSPSEYAKRRSGFHETGQREPSDGEKESS